MKGQILGPAEEHELFVPGGQNLQAIQRELLLSSTYGVVGAPVEEKYLAFIDHGGHVVAYRVSWVDYLGLRRFVRVLVLRIKIAQFTPSTIRRLPMFDLDAAPDFFTEMF
ncbi:hypothetical protein A2368_00745 [Candidatus Collierbacteria bacterium RIFOXYB1_FULL_49_13]|uniref:Uncharacterized protein n=1 Tax=Candidatus Collierbacteria bacterium RIFOXYB1_FULL_49_13 TaxID=1817728 RepID=A0A1F5FF61_9BACT|nr:MAG: hypothetical protein A2368_00745 [Candidatus Collierbacteria bacterium RIFOXYB1_FULL_49_13]